LLLIALPRQESVFCHFAKHLNKIMLKDASENRKCQNCKIDFAMLPTGLKLCIARNAISKKYIKM
jgi:hypothetical protein